MKKGSGFSKKLNYILLGAFAVILFGVGISAFGTSNPSNFGHSFAELEQPSGCLAGEVVSWTGSAWDCIPQNGFTGYEVVTSTGACRSANALVANCPSNKKVIGGGCDVDTSDPIVESNPYLISGQYTAWRCVAQNSGTSCVAYAICADVD